MSTILDQGDVRELAERACALVTATLEVTFGAVLLDDGDADGLVMVAVVPFTTLAGTHHHRRSTGPPSVLGLGRPTMVEDVRIDDPRDTPQEAT